MYGFLRAQLIIFISHSSVHRSLFFGTVLKTSCSPYQDNNMSHPDTSLLYSIAVSWYRHSQMDGQMYSQKAQKHVST